MNVQKISAAQSIQEKSARQVAFRGYETSEIPYDSFEQSEKSTNKRNVLLGLGAALCVALGVFVGKPKAAAVEKLTNDVPVVLGEIIPVKKGVVLPEQTNELAFKFTQANADLKAVRAMLKNKANLPSAEVDRLQGELKRLISYINDIQRQSNNLA